MPKIDLEGMAPQLGEEAPVIPVDPRVELMLQAIESPRGLSLSFDSPSEAHSARFRFYAARRRQQRRGNPAFNELLFRLEGSVLKIIPPAAVVVKEL